ncbi:MAG: YybH family protein [Bacillota bacterium]
MVKREEICRLLMALDKEFDMATSEKGVEGWVSYFSEDGIMVPSQGEIIKGKEAIYKRMQGAFGTAGFSLRWQPEAAKVSEDGTMGYTYGRYVRKHPDKDGTIMEGTGRYTSIWQLQNDGSWKIVLDIGN